MQEINLKHVARLARMHFKDEELKVFESQVSSILDFAKALKEVDTQDVEATSHPFSISDVFREDIPKKSLAVEEFLKHSPAAKGRFFEVPKVIEDKS